MTDPGDFSGRIQRSDVSSIDFVAETNTRGRHTFDIGNDIAGTPPGRTITLRIWRGGNEEELRATLGEFVPVERPQTEQEDSPESRSNTGRLGLALQPLTPALTQELGLPADTQWLVVMAIDPVGSAADAGIQRGDVIEEVNQQPVRTVAELRELVQRSGSTPLLLLVNHRGITVFVTMKPS